MFEITCIFCYFSTITFPFKALTHSSKLPSQDVLRASPNNVLLNGIKVRVYFGKNI